MYRTDLLRMEKARLDLTDEEIAQLAKLSRPTVSAIFNGKTVKLDSLSAVASVLNIPLSKLFSEAQAA